MIGGIFLVAEARHLEQLECSVAHLVGNDVEELPERCIGSRHSIRQRLLRQPSEDFGDVLVADAYRRPVIPSVHDPTAIAGPEGQFDWQTEGAQQLLQLLQGSVLLEHILNRVIGRVRRREILDLNSVGLRLGRYWP